MNNNITACFRTNFVSMGSSQAVRIPRIVLETLSYGEHESLDLSVAEDGSIVIRKAKPGGYKTLKDRFAGYTGNYTPHEWDTGRPVGKEIW